jgi:transcriptional regulator with XRE-family HTH domain
MEKNAIQETIEQLRAKGWTVSSMADAVGVPRPTLERWRHGSRFPTHAEFVRRALAELLTRKRIPKRKRYRKVRRKHVATRVEGE